LRTPLVSSQLVEKELQVTQQGALKLIGELNLREITGRGRFRAWGIL
ncbi:helix-turn-helix domain-containing protein, partial [Brucella melitensis]